MISARCVTDKEGQRLRAHLASSRVTCQAKSVGINETPLAGCGFDHIEEEEVVSDRVRRIGVLHVLVVIGKFIVLRNISVSIKTKVKRRRLATHSSERVRKHWRQNHTLMILGPFAPVVSQALPVQAGVMDEND
jgi:hypothetical protein